MFGGTYSGGSGTVGDPYRISTAGDIVVLGTEFTFKEVNGKRNSESYSVIEGMDKHNFVTSHFYEGNSKVELLKLIEDGNFDGEEYDIMSYWGDVLGEDAPETSEVPGKVFNHVDRLTGAVKRYTINSSGPLTVDETFKPFTANDFELAYNDFKFSNVKKLDVETLMESYIATVNSS